jgi:phosphoribosylamine--glycine ligase
MGQLKVLVVGGGGREHAITWALSKSARVEQLYIAPGNAGTATLGENVAIKADDVAGLVAFVQAQAIDFVVVGPEAPLVLGLVDRLAEIGVKAFGCSAAASQLEASKVFSKAFMQEHGIPTAEYATFDNPQDALDYLGTISHQVVVKTDGLAAGKGVFVCDDNAQAQQAIKTIMQDGAFGESGAQIVIEERMTGREVSVLAFSDGKNVALMPPMRDHKRIFDHDEGPNTGGMGAFGPVSDVSQADLDHFKSTVIQPAIDGMAKRGTPYVGVLYAGLMLPPNGVRTLEFNCRFGDPETQAILPLLKSDLLEVMLACVDGNLDAIDVQWHDGACATVVASAKGYPAEYEQGLIITGIDDITSGLVFHAGVQKQDQHFITAGGRVLAVSAIGDTLDDALNTAYAELAKIAFDGMHYRRDIGRTH